MSDALAKVERTPAQMEFTLEQRKIILDSFLSGASEAEAAVLLELARVRRLNPITRQIHFVKRWDSEKNREVWAAQVGIDGFRSIAERTGLYDGQDEAEFEYDPKGLPHLCRVRVYRKDWGRPSVGVAHFSEYAQTKKDGSLVKMWASKPHVMLAKCAEALAFRKAFPEDTSGLCSPEEMPEPGSERDVTPAVEVQAPPAATVTGSRTAQLKAQLAARVAKLPAVTEAKPARKMVIEDGDSPAEKIKTLGVRYGKTKVQMASYYRGATGKKDFSNITAEDAAAVEASLIATATEPPDDEPLPGGGESPEPPPTDSEF